MASFDYFSQLQGPVINTSLFSDAATAGINAGNKLPTKTTSIIRGIQEGLDRGIKDVKGINDIMQIPVENEIRQEQLESQQQLNEINSLKLETAKETQAQNLQTEKIKAQDALQDAQNQRLIAEALGNPDPQVRASVISDPRFTGTLMRNKEIRETSLSRLGNDPNQPEAVRKQATQLQVFKDTQEHQEKLDAIAANIRKSVVGDEGKIFQKYRESNLPAAFNELGLDISNPSDYSKILEFKMYQDGLKSFKGNTLDPTQTDSDLSISKQLNPGKYAGVMGNTKANVLLDDQDYKALAGIQSYFRANGVAMPAATLTPAPAPKVAAPSASQPFLGNFVAAAKEGAAAVGQGISTAGKVLGGMLPDRPQPVIGAQAGPNPNPTPDAGPQVQASSQDSITQLKRAELQRQAQSDPDFRNRLIAKGKLEGEQTAPITQAVPSAEPSATPEPLPGGEGGGGAGGGLKVVTPREAHAALTPSAKRHVEIAVLDRVQGEKLVSKLSPLEKAVVAVESGGNRGAKSDESSATGLFQLTEAAAKDTKVNKSNPASNVNGGVAYLKEQLSDYNNHEIPALLAYRLGPAVVREAVKTVNSVSYDAIVSGLHYLKEKGRFKAQLGNAKKLKEALSYPFKVLAYKEAFEVLGRGRRIG